MSDSYLQNALRCRDAPHRKEKVPDVFASAADARSVFESVLLHEAREEFAAPLQSLPTSKLHHTLDLDTEHPGIYARQGILRLGETEDAAPEVPPVVRLDPEKAEQLAEKAIRKETKRLERSAETAVRRETKQREAREARANETADQRAARLEEARAKKEARRAARDPAAEKPRAEKPPAPVSDDAALVTDASFGTFVQASRKGGKLYANALPIYRHLSALERAHPQDSLRPALLHGTESDELEIIVGPPGTGKSRELVRRAGSGRVLLCAPTNVCAAHLYSLCRASGLDAALCMAPERIPVGTAVESTDASRRVVCATISGRNGPILSEESFETILVDEAAQTSEALLWTLLRPDVHTLVLAGDTQQLPALCSASGADLQHGRSLMERLLTLGYGNVVRLNVQHRMAPQVLDFPNRTFYGGALTSGEGAPAHGAVRIVRHDGAEEAVKTSYRNAREAELALEEAEGHEDTVILVPYKAQAECLLSHRRGVRVHTVDSFQGHEARKVVLCTVRSAGIGFWEDERRLNVALTRAREELVVLASGVERWPTSALKALCSAG
jgi:hypothetical protein